MAAPKKSVDEIWRELNQRPAPRGNVVAPNGLMTSLGGTSNLPGITSTSRTLPAGANSILSTPSPATTDEGGMGLRRSTYDPTLAGVSPEDLQAILSSIQRTINCLSDPDRSTRKRAASTLQGRLKAGDSSGPAPGPAMLQALICGPLLHPLVSALHDQGEAVRLTSAEILCHAATTVSDFSPALPLLIPEVVTRMGKLPVLEPAEEVRLQLASLVSAIAIKSTRSTIEQYATDLCTFILRALEDPFHEINKVACACLRSISSTLQTSPNNLSTPSSPLAALEPSSEKLLHALIPGLQHPHSKVRLEIIEALGALLHSPSTSSCSPSSALMGCISLSLIESSLAPSLRPVAYDKTPAVRRALFISLASWLGYRRPPGALDLDDGYSLSSQGMTPINPYSMPRVISSNLLPLLLIGVTDPHAPLATLALQLIEGVGLGWEKAGDEVLTPLPPPSPSLMDTDDPQPQHQPSPMMIDDDMSKEAAVVACQLGPPYHDRPGPGARIMAKDLLPLLLPPLLAEVGEWTVNQRVCASRQLHTLLVLSEDGCIPQLPRLLQSICHAIGDESVEVAQRVVSSVHIIGAHVKPELWLPLMLDNVSNSKLSLIQKANTLVVLSGLLHTCAKVHTLNSGTEPLLVTLASTLAGDDMRAAEHLAIRAQLLACCLNLTRWLASSRASSESRSSIGKPLYSLLLQLYGFEKDPLKLGPIQQAMVEIAPACGCSSFESLADLHGPMIMAETSQGADKWTCDSPGYLTFRALLLTSGPSTLGRMTPMVCSTLGPLVSDPEGDSALRLNALDLLDQVMEDKERGPSFLSGTEDEGGSAAQQLAVLTRLLLPPLVWLAGKTAAAIRFKAMTALCTCLRRKLASSSTLQSLVVTEPGASNPRAKDERDKRTTSLLPLIIQSMDEDWYVDLRDVSCRVMELLLGETGAGMSEEGRRLVYPELIKRLDDSSNLVRVAACRALKAFAVTMPPTYCDTNSGYLAQGVVIHMDDSNPEVQEAAYGVLEALAVVKPVIVAQEVIKVKERFRSKHYCEKVLTVCYQVAHSTL